MNKTAMRGLSCSLLLLAALAAQDFRATLNGTIVDTSGAVVPHARVQVKNIETGEIRLVETSGVGEFSAPFLPPGSYAATASAAGFKTVIRDSIILRQGQAFGISLVLEPGSVSDSVTVTGETPLLETETADRATVVDNIKMTQLPVAGRNPLFLAVMVAGVTFKGGAIRPFDNGSIDAWSVNGGFQGQSTFLLDGAMNSREGGGNVALVPEPEAIQEISIKTNAYDAQYGNTGSGIVSMSLKSGSNELHGSTY
ncbi:MAG: carboxypeptidase-like regulatory domain-containing protein, partial [Candidatus Solibacter sp.]